MKSSTYRRRTYYFGKGATNMCGHYSYGYGAHPITSSTPIKSIEQALTSNDSATIAQFLKRQTNNLPALAHSLRGVLSKDTAKTITPIAVKTLMETLCPRLITIEAVITAAKKLDDKLEEAHKTSGKRSYAGAISTVGDLWDKLDHLWQPYGICQILADAMDNK